MGFYLLTGAEAEQVPGKYATHNYQQHTPIIKPMISFNFHITRFTTHVPSYFITQLPSFLHNQHLTLMDNFLHPNGCKTDQMFSINTELLS